MKINQIKINSNCQQCFSGIVTIAEKPNIFKNDNTYKIEIVCPMCGLSQTIFIKIS